jgi:hypothetical protein
MPKIHNNYGSLLSNKMNKSLFNMETAIIMDLHNKKTYRMDKTQFQEILKNNDEYVDVRDVVDDFIR